MSKEDIELAVDYCPRDCIYMTYIDGGYTPVCYYAVLMNECRGCKISECDRYKSGKPLKPRMKTEYTIFWEYKIHDDEDDADIIWSRFR